MANIGKWNVPSAIVTLLSSEMDLLLNNALTVVSGIVNNDTNLDLCCDIWLHLAALSPGAGAFGTLYVLEAIDGSTYPAATAALRNQVQQVLATFALDTTAVTPQDVILRNVLLPPSKFKVVYDNQSGTTLGVGNTVKMFTYNVNENG